MKHEKLIHSVHLGDLIPLTTYNGRMEGYVTELWEVTGVYPYHVVVENEGERQSVSYGELVQMGLEKQDNLHENLRIEKHNISLAHANNHHGNKKEVVEI